MAVRPKGQVLTFEMAVELQGHQTTSQSGAATNGDSHPGWRQTAGLQPATAKGSESTEMNRHSPGSSIEVHGEGAVVWILQTSVGTLKNL